jgi:hypothetical protein
MKVFPMIARIHIKNPDEDEGENFTLWLPLFILVPLALILLLVLFLVALPFLLLATVFTWQIGWWRWVWFSITALFKTMQESSGLSIHVEEDRQEIYIDLN